MNDFAKVDYWFDGAGYDLQTARAMLETRRLLYVGFMRHQIIAARSSSILSRFTSVVSRKIEAASTNSPFARRGNI